MKSEEETKLSLTIGEPLYPVRFHFYSSKVQAAANVSLTAGRLAGAASEAPVELKQDKGQFAFDGKLTIDAEAGNHAYALAYLPAGNYRFVINTGITELGSSGGSFTLDSETVKAEDCRNGYYRIKCGRGAGGRTGSFPWRYIFFRGKWSADHFIF